MIRDGKNERVRARAVTCFRVIRFVRRRRLSRERGERGRVLSLSYPPGAVSPSSLSPLPLVPLRSYQRKILPCSTCLSRVQDGRRSGASGVGRGPSGVVSSANVERIYEGEWSTRERAPVEKKREEFRGTCSVITRRGRYTGESDSKVDRKIVSTAKRP